MGKIKEFLGKKVFAIILSLAMVLQIAGIERFYVFADVTQISSVNICLRVPTAGNDAYPDWKYGDINDGSNSLWTVESFVWEKVNNDNTYTEMDYDDTFEKGEAYDAIILLRPKSTDYRFEYDLALTVNGNGSVGARFSINDGERFYIAVRYVAGEPVKSINLSFGEPVVGEYVSDKLVFLNSTTSDAFNVEFIENMEFDRVWDLKISQGSSWFEINPGPDSYYEYGLYYRINPSAINKIVAALYWGGDAYSGDNYTGVDDDSVLYLNGKEIKIVDFYYGGVTEIVYDPQYKEVDRCDILVANPIIGQHPTFEYLFVGKNYEDFTFREIEVKSWYEGNVAGGALILNKELTAEDVFEAGKTYICIISEPGFKNGRIESDDFAYYVNGRKALENMGPDYTIAQSFIASEEITEMKFNIPTPVAGENKNDMTVVTTPENGFVKDFQSFSSADTWQVSDDGKTYRNMAKDEVFEEEKYYRTSVINTYIVNILNSILAGKEVFNNGIAGDISNDVKIYDNGVLIDIDSTLYKVDLDADGEEDGIYSYFYIEKSKSQSESEADGPKKGTIIKDKKYKYKVTKAGSKDGSIVGELAVTGLRKKSLKHVKIAALVTIDGVKYKVTSVAAKAFKGNKKIVKATIGTNVKSIGANAFSGCTKLAQVTINSKKLKSIGKSAFNGNKKLKKVIIKSTKLKTVGKNAFSRKGGKKITFRVPKSKKKAYKKLIKKAKTKKFVVK